MKKGYVLKTISNLSYVLHEKEIFKCKTKGHIKHMNISAITGDFVVFEITEENLKEGMISKILERKNEIYRPKISNIDRVAIISALKEPKFNSYILTKYLSFIEHLNIEPILVFTKFDLVNIEEEVYLKTKEYEKLGYKIFYINNVDNKIGDWNKLKNLLSTGVTVFTGQSGAGKSTTLNNLLPNLFEPTQEISHALGRGKHTTTKNELFFYKNGFIADTPGFSSFELINISPLQVAYSFSYFRNKINRCKFSDCLHKTNSLECSILLDLKNKKIPNFIYEDYIKIISELEELEKRRKY